MAAPPARLLRLLAGDLGRGHLPAKVADLVLAFASMAIFTRLFSAAEYSLYTLVWAAVTAVHALGLGWLHFTSLRYWKETETGQQGDGFLASLNLTLLGALGCSVALWFLASPHLLPGVGTSSAVLGALLLAVFTVNQHTITRSRAVRELGVFLVLSLLPRVVMIGIGLYVAFQGFRDADARLFALIVSYLAAIAVEVVRHGRSYWPKTIAINRHQLAKLLSYGAPVALVALCNFALTSSDRFLIAHFHGTQIAGEYTIANNLISKADSLTIFVGAAAFPLLVDRFESHGPEQIARDLPRLITTFCAAYVPLILGLALVAEPICALLIGTQYSAAPAIMLALAPTVFSLGVLRYLMRPFQLSGKTAPQLALTAACGALTVLINVVTIQRIGPIGAAWGTGLGTITCCVGHYLWAQRVLPYRLEWRELGKVLLSSAVMTACTLPALTQSLAPWVSLVAAGALAGASYVGMVLLLNVASVRNHFRRLVGRPTS